MTPDDDERLSALMQRAQAGSEEAYADALTSFAILARRFIRRRVGDVVWLDDVVQDALISIDRSRHTFDRHRPVGPWFYAIVRRRLIDAWRRQERTARVEVAVDAPPDRADDVGRCDDEIDFARVRAALAALPPRQRAAVEGIQLNDEPTSALAARLGMSRSAVKVAAHRGYKTLRRLLQGEAVEPP